MLLSIAGPTVSTLSGLRITGACPFDSCQGLPDTLLVAGEPDSLDCDDVNRPALLAWLQRIAAASRRVCSICTGAFCLAEAGLLKGRRATTHYEHIDSLKELYSETEITEDLFVFDGKVITCCGGSAATDFALHIIHGMHGDSLANAAARYLFHQSLRPHGSSQNPGSIEPLGSTAPAVLKRAIKLMEENLEEALSIPQICKRVRLSRQLRLRPSR